MAPTELPQNTAKYLLLPMQIPAKPPQSQTMLHANMPANIVYGVCHHFLQYQINSPDWWYK